MKTEDSRIPLSEFITLQRGFDLPASYRKEGVVPVVASTTVVGRHNVAKVKGPGVLIGRSGSIGGGQYIKQDFWPLNTTLWVKDFKGNNQRFVFYLLRGIDFTRFNAGAGVPTLNRNHLANILIREWPLEVQNKITSILSAYDDLIENNNRRIALLEESARLLYREWFVRLRFPGHENTRITDGVPEGWERMFVPDIIDINPKEKIEKGKDIRSIPMACLSTNSTVIDTDRVEIKPKASGAKFRNGDVILPRITPCLENGKTALVKFLSDNEVACGSTEYIILRGQMVSPEFTYCLARTYDFRENAIKSMVGSSGRQRVQVSCFQDFLVPLAPRILLDQFDNIAKPNFMMIQTLQTQNHKLKTARDLLLPKLMNGEIPV